MADPVDKAYLVLHFAEFSDVDETRVTSLNDSANMFISENVFGDMTRYARMLWIAHTLKLSDLQGSGPLTSEKVGDLARSYATPAEGELLSTTSYGTELKKVMRIKARGQMFVPSNG